VIKKKGLKRASYNDGKACGISYRSRWGAAVSKKTGKNLIHGVGEKTESWKPGFLTWEKASDIAPALWVSFYDLAPRYSILL
jgi:hypothetical protein